MKRLPKPRTATVRFQTSQRGVKFATLAEAKKDFLAWLDTGESPAGADTQVHIWQNKKERIVEKLEGQSGDTLREVLRSALRSRKLQIRKVGPNR